MQLRVTPVICTQLSPIPIAHTFPITENHLCLLRNFVFFFLFILSFSFTTQNGSVVGPLLIAPLLGLGIYGFDFANDISLIMYAIMKLSFVRVGVVSLVLSVFGYDRAQLECPDVYCHFDDPKVLLRFLRIEKVVLWHEVGYLLFYVILFRMVLYLTLKRRILS